MELFILLIGLVIGSFLNVVIYRLPRGESIVFPPSHCPECDHKLSVLELIPVISYILLRGKCKECDSSISIRYPIVELGTGLLFLLNSIIFQNYIILLSGLIFTSYIIVLSMIDIDYRILPDKLTLSAFMIGLVLSFFRTDIDMLTAIAGALAGGGLLFVVALISKGGLGGGDIKLLLMFGTFLGPLSALASVFLGAIFGLVANIPGLVSGNVGRKTKIPFGPFLGLAALVFWFFGNSFWQWYLGLIL